MVRVRAKSKLVKGGDTSSQREMITSPSDHSSVIASGTTSCLPQPPFLHTKSKVNTSKAVNSTAENVSNNDTQSEERTDLFNEDTFIGRMSR